MKSPFDTTLLKLLDIDESSLLAPAINSRANLFELTEQSYQAAIFPENPSILNHSQRAAVAVRICLLNDEMQLADHYKELVTNADDQDIYEINELPKDLRLASIMNHIDANSRDPKSDPQSQIAKLKSSGLSDPEIVGIFAIIAFVSYQLRVAKGLRVMKEGL